MKSGISNPRVGWAAIVIGSVSVAAALALSSHVPAEGAPRATDSTEPPEAERPRNRALLNGAISNADGSPVAGAKITVEHTALAQRFVGSTEASGRFSVDVPEGSVRITIEHKAHATHRSQEVLTLPVFRSYTLSARSSLVGKLLPPRGSDREGPLRGTVRLVNADGSVAASTESQQDGSFELSDVTPGNYALLAWMKGFATVVEASVSGGLENRLDIELEPTRSWTVRAGAAALTLEIQEGPWRSRTGEPASSHDESGAVFDLPASVAAYAHLSAPGRATTLRSLADASEPTLAPGAKLQGRVVDAAGAGVSGVPISLTWLDSKRGDPVLQHEATSDAQGEYSLAGLAPGEHELRIQHPRFGTLIENVTLAPGASERRESQLEPKEYLVGRMVDAADLPRAGEPVAFAAGDFGLASAITDSEGAFRLGPLFPAKGMLVGLESYDVQANQFVAPGLAPSSEPFVLRVSSKSAQVTLRVSDSEGAPLEGVEVRVRSPRFGGHRDSFPVYLEPLARSDGSGSVMLQGVPAAQQDVWLSKPGYAAQRLDTDLSSGGPTMMAVLEHGGGFVLEPHGAPAPISATGRESSCRFVVSPEGPSSAPVIDRAQPCTSPLSAEDLFPGRYTVRVFSGGSMITTSAQVKAGRRATLTGPWSRAQELSGSLLKATDQPCAGCLIRDDTRDVYATVDADGRFSLFGYACGEPIDLGVSDPGDPEEQRIRFAFDCDAHQHPQPALLTLEKRVPSPPPHP